MLAAPIRMATIKKRFYPSILDTALIGAVGRFMRVEAVEILGMAMEQWTHETCVAEFGVGDDWATLASIQTPLEDQRKGYATALLTVAKAHYEKQGKRVGGTVTLNDGMSRIYQRVGITEYKDG